MQLLRVSNVCSYTCLPVAGLLIRMDYLSNPEHYLLDALRGPESDSEHHPLRWPAYAPAKRVAAH